MYVKRSLTIIEAVKDCFTNYVNFKGRARNSAYWKFFLFNGLVLIPLYALLILGLCTKTEILINICAILIHLYILVTIVPTIALSVRRLHDTNKSGWLYLIKFVPCVGSIILWILLAQDSDCFTNRYGPSDKYFDDEPQDL